MIGLRTQENDKFIKFFNIVQNYAAKINCIFFLDTGEGHDYTSDDLICQDLSGWLIPKTSSSEFEKDYLKYNNLDNWDNHYKFAVWNIENSNISIDFKKY